MTFFSVLFALLIEQFHALRADNPVHALVRMLGYKVERTLDAGEYRHGVMAWCVVVIPLLLVVISVHVVLLMTIPWAAFGLNVLIVYLTLGFRQFSHYFTDIHEALIADDVETARRELRNWTGIDTTDMPVQDVVRVALEHAIIGAHRHVFGVFFWFLMPLGPAGCVLYRTSEYLARSWGAPGAERGPEFGSFARRAFEWLDWLPARLSALGFAIVGNFEDAIYAWRNFAGAWGKRSEGVLMSAGGGALGVRLGTPQAERSSESVLADDGVLTPIGEETSVRTLQSAVALVWRAVILWMLLLAMLSIAVWLG